ncbi:MAG: hypothetical protein ACXVQR_07295 [Solirubrobacteraceae bacterium]
MERNDPPNPPRRDAEGPEPLDALRRLEERLDRASDAAERLIAEATARVAGMAASARGAGAGGSDSGPAAADAGPVARPGSASDEEAASASPKAEPHRPPPAGWHSPEGPGSSETELLSQVLGALRDLIPPELQRRLAEALRELLLALRALIDWYLERAERRRAEPAVVQDIPII